MLSNNTKLKSEETNRKKRKFQAGRKWDRNGRVVGVAVKLLLHFDHAVFGSLRHWVPRPGSGKGVGRCKKQGETDTNYPPRSHTSSQIKQCKMMRECQRNAATTHMYTNTLEDGKQRPPKQRQTIYTSAHANAYTVQNVHTGRECVCHKYVEQGYVKLLCWALLQNAIKTWGRERGCSFVSAPYIKSNSVFYILQLNASSKGAAKFNVLLWCHIPVFYTMKGYIYTLNTDGFMQAKPACVCQWAHAEKQEHLWIFSVI